VAYIARPKEGFLTRETQEMPKIKILINMQSVTQTPRRNDECTTEMKHISYYLLPPLLRLPLHAARKHEISISNRDPQSRDREIKRDFQQTLHPRL